MSPREHFEQVVAALRAEGLTVDESSQPHCGGTLHDARVSLPSTPSAEEENAFLAACVRAGACISRCTYPNGMILTNAFIQWVEPPACPTCEAAHA